MKDDVRLIFSLIRQQTKMEGEAQELGGWALRCRDQQSFEKSGQGDLGNEGILYRGEEETVGEAGTGNGWDTTLGAELSGHPGA